MSANVMSDELMSKVLDEAWSELSSAIAWNETLLEKYKDKLNWKEVSRNNNILWTPSMLLKFQKSINWWILSDSANDSVLGNLEILEQFKIYFNWNILSRNTYLELSYELIDRFIDLWDWNELINRFNDELYSFDFLEKYQDRIPLNKLKNSSLWTWLVKESKKSLLSSLIQ